MKSRSEVMRDKAKADKAEAPKAEGRIVCPACERESPLSACRTRGDGDYECPECGCSCRPGEGASSTRVDVKAKAAPTTREMVAAEDAKKKPEPAPQFCGECGTELTRSPALATSFFACGHTKKEHGVVDDPRAAKSQHASPAPHRTRTEAETARRNVEGVSLEEIAKRQEAMPVQIRSVLAEPAPGSNRISIAWGKARMPIDRFNSFEVGGHIVTVDLPPDADRVEAARAILADLEAIAETAFRRQHEWYAKKLKLLGQDGE